MAFKKPYKPNPGMLPAYLKWQQDVDYADALDPEALKYLTQFLDEYYRGERRYEEPLHTPDQFRAVERAKYKERVDVQSFFEAGGKMQSLDEAADKEGSVFGGPTPEYLEGLQYREAREEFRALVDVPEEQRTARQQARLELLQMYLLSIAEAD